MKRSLLLLLFVCAFSIMLALSASAADVRPSVELEDGTTISQQNDIIYLPSHADVTKLKIKFMSFLGDITLNGNKVSSGDVIDISSFAKTDKSTRITYYEVTFVAENAKVPEDVVRFYKADSLPTVHITTSIGRNSLLDNTIDSNASVKLIDKNGTELLGEKAEARTRGNSTDTYSKKPFQIKFSSGIDVMGMGKAKSWLLLANYLDQSYIRNNVFYKLARELGMGACDFENVELYIDGQYQGVYLLCEKVNINPNRVNISELEKQNDSLNPQYSTKTTVVTEGALIDETVITEYKYVNGVVNPNDITGGYLIELDNNSKDSRSSFESYFMTKTAFGENLYVIQSPEMCSKEQVEYIARLFAEMEEAMASSDGKNSLGKHYTEYIDLDTFAVAYIMAELGRNYDAGSASVYFNKNADAGGSTSKIVKGPLWDCDNTLGNIHRNDAQNQKTMWAANRTPWNMLTKHSDFNAQVKTKFEQAYDIIYDMLDKDGFIDEQIKELGFSAEMDRLRWNQADKDSWPTYADGSLHWFQLNGNAFPTYPLYTDRVNNTVDTAIGYLCKTLEQRTEYLVDEWGCNVTQRTRTLNDPLPPLPDDTPKQDSSVEDDGQQNKEQFPISAIISIIVVVVLIIGVVIFIVIKKKSPPSHEVNESTTQDNVNE